MGDLGSVASRSVRHLFQTKWASFAAFFLILVTAFASATNLSFVKNGSSSCSGYTSSSVGHTCTYENVAPGIDAEVELVALSGANEVQVTNFDDEENGIGVNSAFQPRVKKLSSGRGWVYAEFEFRFYKSRTREPVAIDFPATAVDVDGNTYS